MNVPSRTATLAGSSLKSSCHACAFFHSVDEEYRVLLPFAKEGFDANDKLVQVVDKAHRAERVRKLGEGGIDVEKAEERGQLDLRPWEDAYLRPGHFDQKAMLRLIEQILKDGRNDSHGMTRLWANMEWALTDAPGVHDIVEYESNLNRILPNYDDVVVCTYDLNRFSAPVVMDILRTHPQVIIGGLLQENPFFVPPDAFLEELRERRPSAH